MIKLINPINYKTEGILEKENFCSDECHWNPLPIYRKPVHRCALHFQEITGNKQCPECKKYTKDHKRIKD